MRTQNRDDWRKVNRLCDYLKATQDLHLILKISQQGILILKWFIDASFATHPDFRNHSGGPMRLCDERSSVISGRPKQKLNMRSSTEAKIIAVGNFMVKVLWSKNCLKMQHFPYREFIIQQHNNSAILLQNKGFDAAAKRMRHMDIRFFFVHDCIERGLIKVSHLGTKEIQADYFSKPLKGKELTF